jgi:Beta-lactamase
MTPWLPLHNMQSATVLPASSTDVVPPPERIPGREWLQYVHPEDAGFASAKLTEARACWESLGAAALFVVYQGAVLIDWGETTRRFSCHSVRKSLMSAMYGVYIDQGAIDPTKTLAQLGIDDIPPPLTAEEKQARILDLLAARSGVYRDAAYEPPNPKPPRGSHPPGTHWVYNNWDFNMLLTIFEQETGRPFFEEFARRLATPLGMQDFSPAHGYYHYERQKSMHPAYPIRMSARDMARFGLLYLYQGRWGSQRLLSESYVRESTSRISNGTWTGGYGYMWWLHDAEPFKTLGMFSALGNGGHAIDVLPGAGLVVVTRVDTYTEGQTDLVTEEQRYRLLRLLLEAKVAPPNPMPVLEPIYDPRPVYTSQSLTIEEMAPYCMEVPIPKTDRIVRIFPADERLMIDFGEGAIPFHPLGPDHFIVEDYQAHVYFETGSDGVKHMIASRLLVLTAQAYIDRGQFDVGIAMLEKAVQYYPENPRVYQALAEAHYRQARQVLETVLRYSWKVSELRPRQSLDRSLMAWELITLQSQVMPPETPTSHLERFAGTYGPRRVEYEDGQLFYTGDEQPRRHLTPLTETIWAVEGLETFRVRFDTDGTGRVFRMTGLYRNGRRDVCLRDEEGVRLL